MLARIGLLLLTIWHWRAALSWALLATMHTLPPERQKHQT